MYIVCDYYKVFKQALEDIYEREERGREGRKGGRVGRRRSNHISLRGSLEVLDKKWLQCEVQAKQESKHYRYTGNAAVGAPMTSIGYCTVRMYTQHTHAQARWELLHSQWAGVYGRQPAPRGRSLHPGLHLPQLAPQSADLCPLDLDHPLVVWGLHPG